MSKAIAISAFQSAPAGFRPVYRVKVSNLVQAKGSVCAGNKDGLIAFALPWISVTTLGTIATFSQPDSAFLIQALVPGLLAGASGILLYKASKKAIKLIRSHVLDASV